MASFFSILSSTEYDINYKRQYLTRILSLSQFTFAISFTIYFIIKDQNYIFAGFLTPFILSMLAPTLWRPKFGSFHFATYIYLFASFVSIISVDTYLGPDTNAHLLAFLIFITSVLVLDEKQKIVIFISFVLAVFAFLAPILNVHYPISKTLVMDNSKIKTIRFLLEITIFLLLIFKLYLLKILLDSETRKVQFKSDQVSAELDKKEYLLKILSHDIKSPISNSIRGIDMLIGQDLKNQDHLISVRNSQLAAKEMIDNISSYNFDMTNIQSLSFDTVSLSSVFSRIKPLIESRLTGKNILLNISYPELMQTEIVLNADTFVYQIMGNILSNCIKFSNVNSSIDIEVQLFSDFLVLTIRDHGTGLSPQALLNQKYTTKGTWGEKGSGIGMEIIRKFCDLNKIIISFESKKINPSCIFDGTVVTLKIPRKYSNP